MTHNLSSFNVKVLTDDHGERWYVFFRPNITDPFLMLPEFDVEALTGIVKTEKAREQEK
jgi:hypothetical protein